MIKTTGYILLLISCLSFLSILIVPWIGFSKIQIAGITTGLIITGEILFYLSLIILGKSFWEKIKSKLRFWKVKINDPWSSGTKRHNLKPIDKQMATKSKRSVSSLDRFTQLMACNSIVQDIEIEWDNY